MVLNAKQAMTILYDIEFDVEHPSFPETILPYAAINNSVELISTHSKYFLSIEFSEIIVLNIL